MCETKICSKCKEEKLLSDFYKETRSKSGYNAACKKCIRKYHDKYRAENPQSWLAYSARPDVKERQRQQKRDQYRSEKEEILARNAEYYKKNKEKIYKTRKLWNAENSARLKVQRAARRHRTRRATPNWLSEEQKQKIFDVYLETSIKSAESGEKYEVDHIIPITSNIVCGLHVPWNLQILTQTENRQKSNKLLEEYINQ